MDCKTITLRTRVLKHGMLGFYLDFYPGYRDRETMKVYRHKSIDIQIYAEPKNQREKNFNAQMTEKAEAIRCRIYASVVNDKYDFFDKDRSKVISWPTTKSSSPSMLRKGVRVSPLLQLRER